MRGLLGVTCLLVLAGCFSTNPAVLDSPEDVLTFAPDWDELALPSGEGHDHHDAAQHAGRSTPNFQQVGWNPLVSEYYGHSRGGYLCGDSTQTGERRLAVVHGFGTDVAFYLVDVTNATDPRVLGEFVMPFAPARDVTITPDSKYVVLGTSSPRQPDKPLTDEEARPTWQGPCSEGPQAVRASDAASVPNFRLYSNGAVLVNIQDPESPVIESYWPLPALGAHSIYSTIVGGRTYVLASVVNAVAAVTYFELLEVVAGPNGGQFVHLATLLEEPHQGNAPVLNGHGDGVIQVHPVTGRTLAYLAHWHQGLVLVDITEPRTPAIIGRWSDNPPGNANLATNDYGDVHEALPITELWDGRHYTFIGQEIVGRPTSRASGYLKALDTTDPSRPHEVAMWTLPADVQWGASLQFSTHYVSRVDRTVFMSHYHAGLWAIDVSGLGHTTQLPAVGVFIPANVSPQPRPLPADGSHPSYSWTPTVMETNALPNGDLVVWDMSSGVYLVRFDASRPAPPKMWDAG